MQTATQFCFSFDFDEWAALAKADPRAFEARRLALIEDFLRQFPLPDQRRLRGLQFRIDLERQRARSPMAACLKLSGMMWDSLLGSQGLKRALNGKLTADTARAAAPDKPAPASAQILPFRNQRR